MPFFQLSGRGKWQYDLVAENVLRKDGRYRLFLDSEPVRIKVDYNRIPHRFGNNGRTLLEETHRGVLEISDTLQSAHQTALEQQFAANRTGVNFAFLSNLVAPSLAAANTVDLALLRERGTLEVDVNPGKPLSVKLNYFREKRTGDRAAGTSFGFGNVVESPEPIDYRTEEFGASAELGQKWGLVRGAVRYNTFTNPINTLTFDNPFRVTDSTDPSAYTGPASGSINGPARGRVDLSADNEALTGSVGFLVRLPANSRFTADISASRWTQDDRFMPYSINSRSDAGRRDRSLALPVGTWTRDQRRLAVLLLHVAAAPEARLHGPVPHLRPEQRHEADRVSGLRAVRRRLGGHRPDQRAVRLQDEPRRCDRVLRPRPRDRRGGIPVSQVEPGVP